MAVSAATVWEVQTGGSDNNGGGFVTGATGTDNTVSNTPVALTGVTSSGAGNTILSASAADSWVGLIFNVVSGTNFTTTANASRFECLSVVVGVSATFGTNLSGASISTGVGANGVLNGGGALKLDSAGTAVDTILENMVAGNILYWKAGAYTVAGAISLTAAGSTTTPIKIIGYNSTRGDNPTPQSSNQPVVTRSTSATTLGAYTNIESIAMTGSGTSNLNLGAGGRAINVKASNTGTGTALSPSGADSCLIGCEITAPTGIGSSSVQQVQYIGCYFHDCDIGIRSTANTAVQSILDCIIDTCTTAGIQLTAGSLGSMTIKNCTLYGAATPAGSSIGLSIATGSTDIRFLNNIVSGWVTGINHADAQTVCYSDFNNFHNNTTARTNWVTGSNDIAVDPSFVDAPNGNFAVGTAMQDLGFPILFPGGLSTSYVTIGAVQSSRAGQFTDVLGANVLAAVGAYKYNSKTNNRTPTVVQPAVGDVKSGVTYGPSSSLTGTGANITGGGSIFPPRR